MEQYLQELCDTGVEVTLTLTTGKVATGTIEVVKSASQTVTLRRVDRQPRTYRISAVIGAGPAPVEG